MVPSPKLPTKRSLLKLPKFEGASRNGPRLIDVDVAGADQALLQLAVGVVDIDAPLRPELPSRRGRQRPERIRRRARLLMAWMLNGE